jgi:hypothetical protein
VSTVQEMLRTHPRPARVEVGALAGCIQACFDCAQSCTACADACLGEQDLQMLVRCIRLNLDCADVCGTTGRLLSRQTEADWEVLRLQLNACAAACQVCGVECEKHAEHHEHCKVCAEACRRCEQACNSLLGVLAKT